MEPFCLQTASGLQVDLQNREIASLLHPVKGTPLIDLLQQVSDLYLLDLSSNDIMELLPSTLPRYELPTLQVLNLSDNPLFSVQRTVDLLSKLTPNLVHLSISLRTDAEADYVIQKLSLQTLNKCSITY
jgi:hypothetical protein